MRKNITLIAVVAALIVAIAVPVAAAPGGKKGKPGGGGGGGGDSGSSSSITLDQPAPIVHGQDVTFTVSASVREPFSRVTCTQGGTTVYVSTKGHFPDYYEYFGEPIHTLSSAAWTGGDASCTAALIYFAKNGRQRTLASTSFAVSG